MQTIDQILQLKPIPSKIEAYDSEKVEIKDTGVEEQTKINIKSQSLE